MKIVEDNFVKENPEYYVMVCDHCGSKILIDDNEIRDDDVLFSVGHFACGACWRTNYLNPFSLLVGRIRYLRYKKKGKV